MNNISITYDKTNILKFSEYQEYENYILSGPTLPNVSYCVDTNKVYYNPYEPKFITAKYAGGSEVNIINYDAFSHLMKMWIDDVEIDINNDSRIMIPIEQSEYSHVAFNFGDNEEHEIKFAFDRYYLIRDNSFSGCDLYEIFIPDFVTDIGPQAFLECLSLDNIILSEGLINIGSSAFFGDLSLISTTIPSTVESIDDSAFLECINLTEIHMFSPTPPEIGEDVFSGCLNLNIIVLQGSVDDYINSWVQYSDIIHSILIITPPNNPNPGGGTLFNP